METHLMNIESILNHQFINAWLATIMLILCLVGMCRLLWTSWKADKLFEKAMRDINAQYKINVFVSEDGSVRFHHTGGNPGTYNVHDDGVPSDSNDEIKTREVIENDPRQ